MRKLALFMFVVVLAACAPKEPLPAVADELKLFDKDYQLAQTELAAYAKKLDQGPDFRGRNVTQDFDQWVLPKATREKIALLREQAAAANSLQSAKEFLATARAEIKTDRDRATQIVNYWTTNLPAPYWRNYWDELYHANNVAPDKPDPMLLSIEARMKTSLEAGDFAKAGNAGQELNGVLSESLNLASGRILKASGAPSTFSPRKTPCPKEVSAAQGDRPKLVRGEDLEQFYPKDSITRGEEGAVILRARIDSKGCAQTVTVAVHSGVPALDAAALQWFESAQFSPARRDGHNVDADFAFKVRFVLQDAKT